MMQINKTKEAAHTKFEFIEKQCCSMTATAEREDDGQFQSKIWRLASYDSMCSE